MAKRRRSSAQKAAFKKMIAALHAKRRGRGRGKVARRARRSGKRRMTKAVRRMGHKRRGRRSARRSMHVRHVSVPRHTVVKVYRSKRRAKRRAKHYGKAVKSIKINPGRRRRHSRRRHARRNPAFSLKREGSMFVGGLTHFLSNLKASAKGIGGFASIGAGAIGGVFAGTFLAGITVPQITKFLPGFVTSPIGARLLAFMNSYLGGYLLSRFAPGLSDRTRRGILAGATAAALIETVRPGTIKEGIAMIPGVGDAIASKLNDYEMALAGDVMALSGRAGGADDGNVYPAWSGGRDLGAYSLGAYGLGAYGLGNPQSPEMALSCGFDSAGNPID